MNLKKLILKPEIDKLYMTAYKYYVHLLPTNFNKKWSVRKYQFYAIIFDTK